MHRGLDCAIRLAREPRGRRHVICLDPKGGVELDERTKLHPDKGEILRGVPGIMCLWPSWPRCLVSDQASWPCGIRRAGPRIFFVVEGFVIHFKVKKSDKASKERWEATSLNTWRLS
jgi:hypothetical protein